MYSVMEMMTIILLSSVGLCILTRKFDLSPWTIKDNKYSNDLINDIVKQTGFSEEFTYLFVLIFMYDMKTNELQANDNIMKFFLSNKKKDKRKCLDNFLGNLLWEETNVFTTTAYWTLMEDFEFKKILDHPDITFIDFIKVTYNLLQFYDSPYEEYIISESQEISPDKQYTAVYRKLKNSVRNKNEYCVFLEGTIFISPEFRPYYFKNSVLFSEYEFQSIEIKWINNRELLIRYKTENPVQIKRESLRILKLWYRIPFPFIKTQINVKFEEM